MIIEVLIEGLILFVSSGVYKNGLTGTGAAVAVHANARPGTYGVDLPAHSAELLIRAEPVRKLLPEGTTLPLDPAKENYVVELTGKRVQLGTFANDQCSTVDPRNVPGAGGSLKNVPDLTKLGLPSTHISDDARPSSKGEYKFIDPVRVSGWLEMLDGTLKDDTPSKTRAEFRPSGQEFEPAHGATWTVPNATAPCLVITPFRSGKTITVVFEDAKPKATMEYRNLPVPMGGGHFHGRIGAGYDYELLYDIFEQKPTIPPVPHLLFKRPAEVGDQASADACKAFCEVVQKPTADPVSGINCGGGGDPNPGDPKP